MLNRDFEIVISPLSRTVTSNGVTVEVQIYRRTIDLTWSFNILNPSGTMIAWIENYGTDQEALNAFEADLEKRGIESYLDGAPNTCPLCQRL